MADLIRWPFALPGRFLDALGYPRVVEAFDSPAMRARLAARQASGFASVKRRRALAEFRERVLERLSHGHSDGVPLDNSALEQKVIHSLDPIRLNNCKAFVLRSQDQG